MRVANVVPIARPLASRPAFPIAVLLVPMVALVLFDVGAARGATPREPPPAQVRAWQTGMLRPDRLAHASLSLSAGLSIGLLTRRPASAGGVVALGIAKELWDRRRGRGFDWVDLAADVVGAGLAAGGTAALRH